MLQKKYVVAVVGATGAVGTEMYNGLIERKFPVKKWVLLSSERSAGTKLVLQGEEFEVKEAKPESFEGVDIAFFSAGGAVSKALIPEAVSRGCICIDNTNAFRMDESVPLVVPEVNKRAIFCHQGIIANPNCSTIQMVAALKPIYDRYGIERVIVSTYQAVSGAGNKASQELEDQLHAFCQQKELQADVLPVSSLSRHYPLAMNVIPQVDVAQDNGFTLEEMKMIRETKKILDDASIGVTATCVRVPVLRGHSESVYIECKKDYELDELKNCLAQAPGVILEDNIHDQSYPMPYYAAGRTEVFVGRIRRDLTHPRGINLWVVSDNLLKGAATNAIQIAETLIENNGVEGKIQ